MANPILHLLVLLTLCSTCALGVPSSSSDCQNLNYYDAKQCEARFIERHSFDQTVDLSLNLLRHLYSPSRNLVFSPYSLVTALTMTLLGAEGHSRRQLMETLFGSEDERLVEQFISEHAQLTKYSAEQLTFANFLYPDTCFPLKPEYQRKLASDLSAITRTVNFTNGSSAMESINSDVSEATHGMIPRLFSQINPDTALLLINTVYFKGMWEIPFEEARTDLEGTFTKAPGGEVMRIPMMRLREESLRYFKESDGTRTLLLPYNVQDMAMAIFLPPEETFFGALLRTLKSAIFSHETPIESFVRSFKATYLENLLKAGHKDVIVSLPRFKIANTHENLKATLQSLGVSDIFESDNANFSKLTQKWKGLSVGEVLQKAVIEVNEEGTKAAAATAIRFVPQSKDYFPKVHEYFIADRPFVYALVRAPKHAHMQILFMGVVEDPSKE